MKEIPPELEVLVDLLIGIVNTLEKVRDHVYTTEAEISKIEERLDHLEDLINNKDSTNFGNRVKKWLKHTKK